jgi:hypothetical protein
LNALPLRYEAAAGARIALSMMRPLVRSAAVAHSAMPPGGATVSPLSLLSPTVERERRLASTFFFGLREALALFRLLHQT